MEDKFNDINVVNDYKIANCITHYGTFHADEIFATLLLSILKEIKLYRTNEVTESMKENECIIYDIGRGELDHHQKGGNGERKNGIMYASCGLVWKKYHKQILKKIGVSQENIEYLYEKIDEDLIQFIDANDNGLTPYIDVDYKYVTISSIVAEFNPKWDESIDISNLRFIEALNLCRVVLKNEIESQLSKLKAKEKVEKAIENSENNILILNEYMPWKDFVLSSQSPKAKNLLYTIYPSKRGGYALECVSIKKGSFENRKSLPKKWSGLQNEQLEKVTGVKGARFCHIACFLATTDTLDGAVKLAKIALKNTD